MVINPVLHTKQIEVDARGVCVCVGDPVHREGESGTGLHGNLPGPQNNSFHQLATSG